MIRGVEVAAGGGEIVGGDGEGEKRLIVFFGEADGGSGGGEGGAEGAVEGGEGDPEIDGVVLGGGLDGVGFEDFFLRVEIKRRYRDGIQHTMERTLQGS